MRLQGGLGNQLFQLSFACYLKQRFGDEVRVDTSSFVRRSSLNTPRRVEVFPEEFGIDTCSLSPSAVRFRRFVRKISLDIKRDPWEWSFDSLTNRDVVVEGYFQADSLVELVASQVLPILTNLTAPFAIGEPFAAAHIRLGDYLHPTTRALHGLTDPEWTLLRCLELAESRGVSKVVAFTDSPELLSGLVDRKILSQFEVSDASQPLEVLGGLASAKALVMSNSSLSWWGARLLSEVNLGDGNVIFPVPWISLGSPLDETLYRSEWVRCSRAILPMASRSGREFGRLN